MGIKDFSKVFKPAIIKPTDLKNMVGAFDASVILYQSALGMQSVKGLTDSLGNPTIHINVLLLRVLNFIKNNTGQIWVLDYHEKGYISPDKEIETAKRQLKKHNAKKKLLELENSKNTDDLFSDEDDDIERKINQQEKISFTMNDSIVNDCKFILDCLDITWCISPKGIEAEQLCAELTLTDELDFVCDFVYSTDVDSLLYGAQQLVRSIKCKDKKVLQLYNLDNILNSNKLEMDDLLKISVILGSDHSEKTPGVGPKTVIKKYKDIKLSKTQETALNVFKKPIYISSIVFSNEFDSVEPASNNDKIIKLLDWLELKNFNRERIKKQLLKVNDKLVI